MDSSRKRQRDEDDDDGRLGGDEDGGKHWSSGRHGGGVILGKARLAPLQLSPESGCLQSATRFQVSKGAAGKTSNQIVEHCAHLELASFLRADCGDGVGEADGQGRSPAAAAMGTGGVTNILPSSRVSGPCSPGLCSSSRGQVSSNSCSTSGAREREREMERALIDVNEVPRTEDDDNLLQGRKGRRKKESRVGIVRVARAAEDEGEGEGEGEEGVVQLEGDCCFVKLPAGMAPGAAREIDEEEGSAASSSPCESELVRARVARSGMADDGSGGEPCTADLRLACSGGGCPTATVGCSKRLESVERLRKRVDMGFKKLESREHIINCSDSVRVSSGEEGVSAADPPAKVGAGAATKMPMQLLLGPRGSKEYTEENGGGGQFQAAPSIVGRRSSCRESDEAADTLLPFGAQQVTTGGGSMVRAAEMSRWPQHGGRQHQALEQPMLAFRESSEGRDPSSVVLRRRPAQLGLLEVLGGGVGSEEDTHCTTTEGTSIMGRTGGEEGTAGRSTKLDESVSEEEEQQRLQWPSLLHFGGQEEESRVSTMLRVGVEPGTETTRSYDRDVHQEQHQARVDRQGERWAGSPPSGMPSSCCTRRSRESGGHCGVSGREHSPTYALSAVGRHAYGGGDALGGASGAIAGSRGVRGVEDTLSVFHGSASPTVACFQVSDRTVGGEGRGRGRATTTTSEDPQRSWKGPTMPERRVRNSSDSRDGTLGGGAGLRCELVTRDQIHTPSSLVRSASATASTSAAALRGDIAVGGGIEGRSDAKCPSDGGTESWTRGWGVENVVDIGNARRSGNLACHSPGSPSAGPLPYAIACSRPHDACAKRRGMGRDSTEGSEEGKVEGDEGIKKVRRLLIGKTREGLDFVSSPAKTDCERVRETFFSSAAQNHHHRHYRPEAHLQLLWLQQQKQREQLEHDRVLREKLEHSNVVEERAARNRAFLQMDGAHHQHNRLRRSSVPLGSSDEDRHRHAPTERNSSLFSVQSSGRVSSLSSLSSSCLAFDAAAAPTDGPPGLSAVDRHAAGGSRHLPFAVPSRSNIERGTSADLPVRDDKEHSIEPAATWPGALSSPVNARALAIRNYDLPGAMSVSASAGLGGIDLFRSAGAHAEAAVSGGGEFRRQAQSLTPVNVSLAGLDVAAPTAGYEREISCSWAVGAGGGGLQATPYLGMLPFLTRQQQGSGHPILEASSGCRAACLPSPIISSRHGRCSAILSSAAKCLSRRVGGRDGAQMPAAGATASAAAAGASPYAHGAGFGAIPMGELVRGSELRGVNSSPSRVGRNAEFMREMFRLRGTTDLTAMCMRSMEPSTACSSSCTAPPGLEQHQGQQQQSSDQGGVSAATALEAYKSSMAMRRDLIFRVDGPTVQHKVGPLNLNWTPKEAIYRIIIGGLNPVPRKEYSEVYGAIPKVWINAHGAHKSTRLLQTRGISEETLLGAYKQWFGKKQWGPKLKNRQAVFCRVMEKENGVAFSIGGCALVRRSVRPDVQFYKDQPIHCDDEPGMSWLWLCRVEKLFSHRGDDDRVYAWGTVRWFHRHPLTSAAEDSSAVIKGNNNESNNNNNCNANNNNNKNVNSKGFPPPAPRPSTSSPPSSTSPWAGRSHSQHPARAHRFLESTEQASDHDVPPARYLERFPADDRFALSMNSSRGADEVADVELGVGVGVGLLGRGSGVVLGGGGGDSLSPRRRRSARDDDDEEEEEEEEEEFSAPAIEHPLCYTSSPHHRRQQQQLQLLTNSSSCAEGRTKMAGSQTTTTTTTGGSSASTRSSSAGGGVKLPLRLDEVEDACPVPLHLFVKDMKLVHDCKCEMLERENDRSLQEWAEKKGHCKTAPVCAKHELPEGYCVCQRRPLKGTAHADWNRNYWWYTAGGPPAVSPVQYSPTLALSDTTRCDPAPPPPPPPPTLRSSSSSSQQQHQHANLPLGL
ncbi:hypothetical protein CBR_g36973 [Chara braunii]|uniref:Uncharacterized protein n=1 Tax=Chara braunii TaxID=69332 RepID=A0A388JZL0_CHABU|nr:hypothetical protein CBR_g36973 [Chara braunii]|eukprot:GBG63205.1 hypothetical protein CBR_g36973 [Chara braunii]